MMFFTLAIAALAFVLSASAGLGGSLILVPGLCLLLGAKKGIALAALLLGFNNIAKVFVYRNVVPWRAASWVLLFTACGAVAGAGLLVRAPESWVGFGVVIAIVVAFLFETGKVSSFQKASGPLLAFSAGATSGFSGTSGPLKGAAIKTLGLNRAHFVGAASVVSLVGDLTKAAVYSKASLLVPENWGIVAAAVPLMMGAALLGRKINRSIGERAYNTMFWGVMVGYSIRLLLA